jgi:metal-sulfur cluster biosynthetic enzyme
MRGDAIRVVTIGLMNQAANLSGRIILSGDAAVCQRVLDVLRAVIDAESAQNIVELGLVNSVHAEPGTIEVVLHTACPTCPMGSQVMDDAFVAVRAMAPPDSDIFVLPIDQQTWTPVLMNLDGRKRLGWE